MAFCTSKWGVLGISLLALGVGCARKAKPIKADSPATGSVSSAPALDAVDPVTQKLQAIVAGCRVNVKQSVVSGCANDEKQALVRFVAGGDRVSALGPLVTALESNDKALQTAAAKVLEGAYRTNLGRVKPDQIEPALAMRLLTAVSRLDAAQAVQAVPAAVHVSNLVGHEDALERTLATLPLEVRAAAYVHLLRYGGAAQLPKVEALIKSPEPQIAAAAVEALRRLPNQSDAEKKQVCELVKTFAQDERAPVAGKALSILVSCGGDAVDVAMQEVESRRKAKKLDATVLRALDGVCMDRNGTRFGTAAQCTKIEKLLEGLVRDTKQTDEVRVFALLSLGLQFPGPKTQKLCERLAKGPEGRLSAAAQRVLTGMKTKRAQPAGSATSAAKPLASAATPSTSQ